VVAATVKVCSVLKKGARPSAKIEGHGKACGQRFGWSVIKSGTEQWS
jgi:hypothetical protein